MEQTSLNRIISLHTDICNNNSCPNSTSCYLKKRESIDGLPLPASYKEDILKQGFTVYDALCRSINRKDKILLDTYKKYNITVSLHDYLYSVDLTNYSQIQVSIYNAVNLMFVPNECTKLFLLKDLNSYNDLQEILNTGITNLHINIDKTSNLNRSSLLKFCNSEKNITIDSCITSLIFNGHCPYKTDYIDISYDWTIRKCPFEVKGTSIPYYFDSTDYNELFNIKTNNALLQQCERLNG